MNDYFTWNPSSSTRIIPSEKADDVLYMPDNKQMISCVED